MIFIRNLKYSSPASLPAFLPRQRSKVSSQQMLNLSERNRGINWSIRLETSFMLSSFETSMVWCAIFSSQYIWQGFQSSISQRCLYLSLCRRL